MCSDSCEVQLASLADVLEYILGEVRLSRLLLHQDGIASGLSEDPVASSGYNEASEVRSWYGAHAVERLLLALEV